ncbi:hypothetical protein TNCV_1088921 [Trichonephila clavipes]|uniref:Uncharacterized protein n=1 Tax=Trichonephila clavipes TaxID=2585209 RepID=A0A8X6SRU1_TRICX|nr:hypothetical protein TNCV_1088921 [Trichonephila clavipes]
MIPAKNKRGTLLSISGETPISFPEGTSMPFSGFKPESSRLQADHPTRLVFVVVVSRKVSLRTVGQS